MIMTLTGVISEKLRELVVVDVAGVGYGVFVTIDDLSRLVLGQKIKLYIHEHIREQSHDLFGFVALPTKELFEQLLSVKNVGPKVALAVLDSGSVDDVRVAIAGGDIKRLQAAKGVGKRAAEQIVVELRDKVGVRASKDAEAIVGRAGVSVQDEAVQALIALGYSDIDATAALRGIDPMLPTETRITLALKAK